MASKSCIPHFCGLMYETDFPVLLTIRYQFPKSVYIVFTITLITANAIYDRDYVLSI